jgi:hypothetical protein
MLALARRVDGVRRLVGSRLLVCLRAGVGTRI